MEEDFVMKLGLVGLSFQQTTHLGVVRYSFEKKASKRENKQTDKPHFLIVQIELHFVFWICQ